MLLHSQTKTTDSIHVVTDTVHVANDTLHVTVDTLRVATDSSSIDSVFHPIKKLVAVALDSLKLADSIPHEIASIKPLILSNSETQDTLRLTQEEVINIARKQSLDAFRAKNMFISNYWAFRSFKAGRRPILWLNTTPIDYNNTIDAQYDFASNSNYYVKTNTAVSNVSVSLNQSIPWTGGSIYMDTKLERYQNFQPEGSSVSYSTGPIISLGLNQSLNLYNPLKWQAKLQPLEFAKKKKEYLQNVEQVSINAINYFFTLASAQVDMNIATNNLENTKTLFDLGKSRYAAKDISQDEYLDLELNQLNAEIAFAKAQLDLQQAQQTMNSFLVLKKNTYVICIISAEMPITNIDFKLAYDQALTNNPVLMWYQERLLSSNEDVERTKADAGFSGNLSAKYGFTGTGTDVAGAYQSPGAYQKLGVSFSYPLVDWGERRGKYLMAKSNREVTQAEVDQARIDFEQDLYMRVMKFNIQEKRVQNSSKADQIGNQAYQVTSDRFKQGQVNVVKLNSSRSSREGARRAYINSLKEYWIDYYYIRKICLYDFERNISFNEDFDRLVNEH